MNKTPYRDPNTNQYVFINAITGQKTFGTNWEYEKKERELNEKKNNTAFNSAKPNKF